MSQAKVKYVNIPLQYERLKDEITQEVTRVFERGDFILGAKVEELEKRFAGYCGTRYALGVANGTDALFMVMKALGIGPGDEVITAPNSFIASAAAIMHTGARAVFADVREDYNIDPEQIEQRITGQTKAIMPVHLTGRIADMDRIMELAKKHQLFVVEDAAQAVGARLHGKRAGSFGNAGCFSLHPLKNLNAYGDGGMITTNDAVLYEQLKKLRNHGLRNRDECDFWGYNSRLDTLQAAIVDIKLDYLDHWNMRCREIASHYRRELKGIVWVPEDRAEEEPCYHTFVIQADRRDELQAYLLEQGVETKIHYPIPIHLQKAAEGLGHKQGDFPVCERLAEKILSLPIYPELTLEQEQLVIEGIKGFYSRG